MHFCVDGERKMLEVRNISIDEIKPYENNPRRIGPEAVKAVAASIREFGFKVPVVIDDDMVIVTGHTRVLAARELGMHEVPCIVVDDLTPEQIRAFRLADNKVSELTNWDIDRLAVELEELSEIEIDMTSLGFSLNVGDTPMFENEEIDTDEYSEEKFKHECPVCGFRF